MSMEREAYEGQIAHDISVLRRQVAEADKAFEDGELLNAEVLLRRVRRRAEDAAEVCRFIYTHWEEE
jgi:hypothetical protein